MEMNAHQQAKLWLLAGATAALLLLAACSGNGDGTEGKGKMGVETDPPKPKTVDMPQTLTLLNDDGAGDELMVELVNKKYPNTKLQVIKVKDSNPEELVASGSFPDLMFASATWFQRRFMPLEVQYDLSESIKRHQIDLSKYESYMINDIRKMGKGSIIALPYYADFSGVTYYNKDIFDHLAVPYPKDGMYWEDYYSLSRQLTRKADGVQYVGVDASSFRWGGNGLLPVDPKTDKASLTSNGWLDLFKLMRQFYDIPGAERPSSWSTQNWLDAFFKERSLAVLSYRNQLSNIVAAEKAGNPMNWDMVTYPYFKGSEGFGMKKKAFVLGISSTSKQKEAAFEVLSFLVSEEAQTYISKNAYVPAMTSAAARGVFGESVPALKGKNTKAITTVKPFPDEEVSVYDDLGQTQLAKVYSGVLEGSKDINTVLRENNELLDETIRREKNK
ncbi:MAG: extracellular solute-binding protein family 1 [Paenibacillus sp.]|jgi:multiple sugar transport system substrate-binding protein|nr:extracellular solute-binding protein family 1 [Paenibacillus sp.]